MKYLVNRETKEHKVASEIAAAAMTRYPSFAQDWNIVEADAEGWIPWSGGGCPLPDNAKYQYRYRDGEICFGRIHAAMRWKHIESDGDIIAYRPILSETAEKEEMPQSLKSAAEYISDQTNEFFEEWLAERADNVIARNESVFDRLKSAIAASESIPSIIAEINALLPEGYCVAKRSAVKDVHIEGVGGVTLTAQPAEDMSDWRNWREGDLVSHKEGGTFKIVKIENPGYVGQYGVRIVDSNKETHWMYHKHLSFHSRPAKVAGK